MCQPIATASIWNDSDDSTRVHQKRWNGFCRGRLISGSRSASSTRVENVSAAESVGWLLESAGGVFIDRWIVVPYNGPTAFARYAFIQAPHLQTHWREKRGGTRVLSTLRSGRQCRASGARLPVCLRRHQAAAR